MQSMVYCMYSAVMVFMRCTGLGEEILKVKDSGPHSNGAVLNFQDKMRANGVIAFLLLCSRTCAYTSTFKPYLQKYIVDMHNSYRSSELPWPAADMQKIQWSHKLANAAAAYSQHCRYGHHTQGYGQNLFRDHGRGYGQDHALVNAFMSGFGHREKVYMVKRERPMNQRPVGINNFEHYSQVIWSRTKYVGCSYSTCPQWNGRIVVCNYYPPGNVKHQGWYIIGPSCSRCPRNHYCQNGFCISNNG